MVKSLTVAELIAELKKQPQHYKVFTATDPEGNNYGALRADLLIGGSDDDKVLMLYPIETYQHEDIAPNEFEKIMRELDAEGK